MILAYLARSWQTLVAAVAACALCFILGQCDGKATQKAKDALALKRAEAAALRVNAAATEIAATQRETDTAAIAIQDKDRTDAITAAPPSRTGAANRALGCQRVRQASGDNAARAAGC